MDTILRPRPARAAVKATCEEEEENDWSEDGWLLTSDDDLFNKNYSWALLWKDDPDRRVCCGSSCLSPYISSHQLFSIFFEWPQRYTLRFDLNVYQANWKKIIIMGITTTTTTVLCILYYITYYNLFFVRLWLKYSPTTSSIFLSSCQSPSSRATLCDIYLSLKIIEYFILVLLVPFEHLQPKLLSG
jgi:hypothetical protein